MNPDFMGSGNRTVAVSSTPPGPRRMPARAATTTPFGDSSRCGPMSSFVVTGPPGLPSVAP